MSNSSSFLPWEIIEQIIPRLPAKPLKRFRCVSKSWNQFITSSLCLKQFQLYNPHSDYHTKLLITTSSNERIQKFNQIDCPLDCIQFRIPKFTVLGFCNGLVCFQAYPSRISLWNFVTNEHIDLQEALHEIKRPYCFLSECYGFGYASRSDDYIVCKFCSYRRPADFNSYMDVYSLRYDKWSRIQEVPYRTIDRETGILVNGAVHWLGTPRNREASTVIAFDLDDNFFRELSLPDFDDDNANKLGNVVLDALDDSLCVLCRSKFGHVELWMMKEYGFESTSWTKLYNIKIDGLLCYSKLLCFTNCGANLLIRDGSSILSYDTKEGSLRKLVSAGDITRCHFGAVAYREGFVSLESYKGSKKRKRVQNAA